MTSKQLALAPQPSWQQGGAAVCFGEGEENKGGKGQQLAMQVCLKQFGGKTIEELEGGKEHADIKADAL